MSETASPTKVGVFVVGAAALALGAIVAFGSSRLFTTTERFVIFFEQSLMGLSLGAPVIFQGVAVGTVVDIHAVMTRVDPPLIKTPVTIEVVEGSVRRSADLPEPEEGATRGAVRQLIEIGLRAQLDVQSLVTGQLYVSLVMRPESETVFRETGDTPEIPSIPSNLELIKETLVALANEFRRIPLEQLGDDFVTIMGGLATLVKAPETEQGLRELGKSVGKVNALIASLDGKVDGAYDEYLAVTGKARELMGAAENTLGNVDHLVEPGSAMEQEVMATLREARTALRDATASMQDVTDTLQEVRGRTQTLGALAEDTLGDIGQLVEPGSPLLYELQATLQEVRRATQKLGAMADQMLAQPDSVLFGRGQRKDAP